MVDNITIDPATAQVTYIRGQKLSEPISLTEWAKHTQEYTSLLKEYVLAAYKAQETFKDNLERRPIMQTMDAAIGKEVLDRLQSDMGFTISLIKTTDRWQVPVGEHEVEKPLGTVDLFDPKTSRNRRGLYSFPAREFPLQRHSSQQYRNCQH